MAAATLFVAPNTAEAGVELLSRASGISGAPANALSNSASVSADGRVVAFVSRATNLDPADTSDDFDIYVRDRATHTTSLVSRASGPAAPKANGVSGHPAISANGRYVAFFSDAQNLAPPATGGQVYLRDLQTATTVLVSRASGIAGTPANGVSTEPSISADGQRIVFSSAATNLGSKHPWRAVYVRDIGDQETRLVSRSSGASGTIGNDQSFDPEISADGENVAFTSYATNLVSEQTLGPRLGAVFSRDLTTGRTELVSRSSGRNGEAAGDSGNASVSANGGRIAFVSTSEELDPGVEPGVRNQIHVYLRGMKSDRTRLISRKLGPKRLKVGTSTDPALMPNGKTVLFSTQFYDRDGSPDRTRLFAAELKKRVKPSAVAGAVGALNLTESLEPAVSGTNIAAFESDSPGLAADDTNSHTDVFAVPIGEAE